MAWESAMDIVRIFDTTLRDGGESPGFSMSVPEKVRMAHQLESLGVDIIESGFPIASKGDLEGVRAVCRQIRGCTVRYARERCAELEFSAEDASRTEIGFLCEAVGRAVRAGATTINLPDTVGYAVPEEYAAMFRSVIEYLDGADGVTLSAHCHDDLGLAVANSLAAVQAGARQLELTINGIGEREGNAALEEDAVVLRVH